MGYLYVIWNKYKFGYVQWDNDEGNFFGFNWQIKSTH